MRKVYFRPVSCCAGSLQHAAQCVPPTLHGLDSSVVIRLSAVCIAAITLLMPAGNQIQFFLIKMD